VKVRELIDKLQKLDPEKVVHKRFFDGNVPDDQEIDEVYESSISEFTDYPNTKTTFVVMIS
jgi:hypothetical protein